TKAKCNGRRPLRRNYRPLAPPKRQSRKAPSRNPCHLNLRRRNCVLSGPKHRHPELFHADIGRQSLPAEPPLQPKLQRPCQAFEGRRVGSSDRSVNIGHFIFSHFALENAEQRHELAAPHSITSSASESRLSEILTRLVRRSVLDRRFPLGHDHTSFCG